MNNKVLAWNKRGPRFSLHYYQKADPQKSTNISEYRRALASLSRPPFSQDSSFEALKRAVSFVNGCLWKYTVRERTCDFPFFSVARVSVGVHVCLHVSKQTYKKPTFYIRRYIPHPGECLSVSRLNHNVWAECFQNLDRSAGDPSHLSSNGGKGRLQPNQMQLEES